VTGRRPGERIVRAGAAAALALGALSCVGQRPQRTDYSWLDGTRSRSAGPAVAMRWSRDLAIPMTGNYIPVERAAPAVDLLRERLYVGSTRGLLWALSTDGRELYRYQAGAAIEAQPVVDEARGEVYVATVRGTIAALRGEDGELRWKADAGAAISQPVLLAKDALYVVTDEDAVLALSRADGSVLWRYRRESREGFSISGHAGLTAVDNKVVAAFDDGNVVALDAGDGRVIWEVDTAVDLEDLDVTRRFVDVDTTPAIADGIVYVASFSGGLYGLELETGTVRVHEDQLKGITAITATRDALIVSSAQDGVICLDRPALTPRWQHVIGHGAPGRAEVHGDAVYVAESLGAVLALALSDGQEIGRIHTAHGVTAPPTLAGHRGFVLSNAATLYAFTY
jgi:outer membrane protein assembly factor BamB